MRAARLQGARLPPQREAALAQMEAPLVSVIRFSPWPAAAAFAAGGCSSCQLCQAQSKVPGRGPVDLSRAGVPDTSPAGPEAPEGRGPGPGRGAGGAREPVRSLWAPGSVLLVSVGKGLRGVGCGGVRLWEKAVDVRRRVPARICRAPRACGGARSRGSGRSQVRSPSRSSSRLWSLGLGDTCASAALAQATVRTGWIVGSWRSRGKQKPLKCPEWHLAPACPCAKTAFAP